MYEELRRGRREEKQKKSKGGREIEDLGKEDFFGAFDVPAHSPHQPTGFADSGQGRDRDTRGVRGRRREKMLAA